jgi:hypothetical protein
MEVTALVDGRDIHRLGVHNCSDESELFTTLVTLPVVRHTRHQLHVYGAVGAGFALLSAGAVKGGDGVTASALCASAQQTVRIDASPMAVGILYEVWHTFAAAAMKTIANTPGGSQLTVEDVIRSNGELSLYDILDKYNQRGPALSFFYQAKPARGFYCVYRKRPGEAGVAPDCDNIQQTLQAHAAELHEAGVSYIVVDMTNLPTMSAQADGIQLRPFEVLLEEWTALRAAGVATPQVTAWQTCVPGGTLYQNVLALYNNATYADLM